MAKKLPPLSVASDLEVAVPDVPAPPPRVPAHGRLIPQNGTPVRACPTNIDLDTEEGGCLLMDALGDPDYQVPDMKGEPFMARWYIVTPAESVDQETGEISYFPRTVFISPDGKTLVTTSTVVPHRLAAVLEVRGPGPWEPPLPLIIRERRNRDGKGIHHELRMGRRT
jgi:hypothetical protein